MGKIQTKDGEEMKYKYVRFKKINKRINSWSCYRLESDAEIVKIIRYEHPEHKFLLFFYRSLCDDELFEIADFMGYLLNFV